MENQLDCDSHDHFVDNEMATHDSEDDADEVGLVDGGDIVGANVVPATGSIDDSREQILHNNMASHESEDDADEAENVTTLSSYRAQCYEHCSHFSFQTYNKEEKSSSEEPSSEAKVQPAVKVPVKVVQAESFGSEQHSAVKKHRNYM